MCHLPVTAAGESVSVIMNAGTGNAAAAEQVQVWVGASVEFHPTVLLSHVYQAVQAVGWPKADAALFRETPEPVLRTILTYCYAAGIWSSEDIQAACLHDPTVRYICANDFPSWPVIREFRRRNLPWLSLALQHLLRSITQNSRVSDVRREAERRLARAIQADSNAMDD